MGRVWTGTKPSQRNFPNLQSGRDYRILVTVSFDISTEYFEWLIERKNFDFCSTKTSSARVKLLSVRVNEARCKKKGKIPLCNVPRGKEWSLTRLCRRNRLSSGSKSCKYSIGWGSTAFFFFLPHFFYFYFYSSNRSSHSYYFFRGPRGKITVSQRVAECPEAQVRVFFTLGRVRQESLERTQRRNLTMAIK